jgi:hypothetical protein
MNRLYSLLNPSTGCACCEAERRSAQWKAVAEELETAINGAFCSEDDEIVSIGYPLASEFLDDDFEARQISFYPCRPLRIAPVYTLDGAFRHVADELHRIAALCTETAARLEGGVA